MKKDLSLEEKFNRAEPNYMVEEIIYSAPIEEIFSIRYLGGKTKKHSITKKKNSRVCRKPLLEQNEKKLKWEQSLKALDKIDKIELLELSTPHLTIAEEKMSSIWNLLDNSELQDT